MSEQEDFAEQQEKPSITFEFKEEDSTLFTYARSGLSSFQLLIVVETMRVVAEQEMLAWHEWTIREEEEEE